MKTHMLHELGDHREELVLTRAAREVMPDNFAALSVEVRALAALGETRAVFALADTALSVSAGPFGEAGDVMLLAAQELRAHGQLAQSMEMARRAADWYRNTPADPARGDPLWHDTRRGHAHYLAGEWDEARLLYEELLAREPRHRVRFYGPLGAIAARKGDRAAAEAYLNALANIDTPAEAELYDVGIARARIAVLLGDPQRALAFLLEGYLGGQGVDLHAEVDFEGVLKHDRGFQEFVRPKG
jgi:tetratricopeptide (TPR) repeat protein